jgi:hypothetical protein
MNTKQDINRLIETLEGFRDSRMCGNPFLTRARVTIRHSPILARAIISDVHGNVRALEAVLADIRSRGMDATVNLFARACRPR